MYKIMEMILPCEKILKDKKEKERQKKEESNGKEEEAPKTL